MRKLNILHDSGWNSQYKEFIKFCLNYYSGKLPGSDNGFEGVFIPFSDTININTNRFETRVRLKDKEWVTVDLAIFTGGADVNPSIYGEPIHPSTHINAERDEKESSFYNSLSVSTPKFGICRGSQLLTVLAGGRLVQNISGHMSDHVIIPHKQNSFELIDILPYRPYMHAMIEDGNKTAEVVSPSDHHQMMYPFSLPSSVYQILYASKQFMSSYYQTGNGELKDVTDDFCEPEIVYYPLNTSLCIQGHPEYSSASGPFKYICRDFFLAFLKKHEVLSLSSESLSHPGGFSI